MIDITGAQKKILLSVLAANVPDCRVLAFGSRVRNTSRTFSDLDIVLTGKTKIPVLTIASLKADLEDSSIPFRVDVLDWHEISPEFRRVVEESYEVLC